MGAEDPLYFEGLALGATRAEDAGNLGKYRLIAKLARGGMGTLYLAVLRGPGGFSKIVAVKELRRELASDPALVTMFMEEARLAARLNHPNIAQTMEVGLSGGRHFMAMEYVEGQSLQRLLQRAQERSEPLPLTCQLGIQLELLSALDYAHRLRAFDGTPLGVVHRDVSPHNVLLSYEGQVKLVDFGVAKSDDAAEGSLDGALKGKMKYMAPEQAACAKVDARADLFSVGVMLWEAIAGRRAWEGRDDSAVLQSLGKGEIPRAQDARPGLDPALAAIVDCALSPDPASRFPSALAMHEELARYLATSSPPPVGARALGALVSGLFSEDREKLRVLIDLQLRALSADSSRRSSVPPTQLAMAVTVSDADSSSVAPSPAGSASEAARSALPSAPGSTGPSRSKPSSQPRPRATGVWFTWAATAGVAVALAAFVLGRSSARLPVAAQPGSLANTLAAASPARPARVVVRASPPSARIFLDDEEVANPYLADHVSDGTTHSLRVQAAGYETKTSAITFLADIDVAIDLGLSPAFAAPGRATVPVMPRPELGGIPPTTPLMGNPPTRSPKPIETGNPYTK